ncbi:MAG: four helix bundle protein [Gammaproteobacteria bacterium]|nr:MAG: four helix bundle protein [Gammaproteobacteria bacterium]RKZ71135.1 MAG: four helix bundle protein [Gammaproteobacteria bacterium]
MTIKNFRDLEVWKLGKSIVTDIYQLTGEFPKSETYGLVSQMRRAAVSIPSNIAEGFNRYHNKEYRQFLYIALGSCAELETQLEISSDLKLIKDDSKNEMIQKISNETGMLRNLIKKL